MNTYYVYLILAIVFSVLMFALTVFVLIKLTRSLLFSGTGSLGGLAKRYPASSPPEGPQFTGQTVQIGAVRWRNSVLVSVEKAGLYLIQKSFFFKTPPLLIPWNEFKEAKPVRLYWLPAMSFSIGNSGIAVITVPMAIYEAIQPYLKNA